MSHFVVAVITADRPHDDDALARIMAPWHEFECTGRVDEHVVDVDRTEEYQADFKKHGEDGQTFREFMHEWIGPVKELEPGEEPDREDVHKWGWMELDENGEVTKIIDRTNPNRKWDWYVVGGGYSGWADVGDFVLGNQFRVGDLKLDEMKKLQIAERRARIERGLGRLKLERDEAIRLMNAAGTWFAENLNGDATNLPDDHPVSVAREANVISELCSVFGDVHLPLNCTDVEAWIENPPPVSFWAIVKDGQWAERGEMGWFGLSSDDKKPEDWDGFVEKTLRDLPDDAWVTIVDCHI